MKILTVKRKSVKDHPWRNYLYGKLTKPKHPEILPERHLKRDRKRKASVA